MPKTFDKPLQATQHCRHYDYKFGLDERGPRCAKGFDLSAPGAAKVCMPHSSKGDSVVCLKREEYTEEERRAWTDWSAASIKRMFLIMKDIPGRADWGEAGIVDKTFWGKSGEITCPACDGGTVRWTRASVNGHLWASCSTPNCFSVMQ